MQNRITNLENQRSGEPQHIGEILTELLAQYDRRFPTARIAIVQTAPGIDDLFYPAATSVS